MLFNNVHSTLVVSKVHAHGRHAHARTWLLCAWTNLKYVSASDLSKACDAVFTLRDASVTS